jgi:hypothetical protein
MSTDQDRATMGTAGDVGIAGAGSGPVQRPPVGEDQDRRRGGIGGIIAGVVIVFVGLALLAERFWGIDLWSLIGWHYVWPVLILALGAYVIFRAVRRT